MIENFYYEEFWKEYAWCSCYECDEVFYDLEKLFEHQMIHVKEQQPWIIGEDVEPPQT